MFAMFYASQSTYISREGKKKYEIFFGVVTPRKIDIIIWQDWWPFLSMVCGCKLCECVDGKFRRFLCSFISSLLFVSRISYSVLVHPQKITVYLDIERVNKMSLWFEIQLSVNDAIFLRWYHKQTSSHPRDENKLETECVDNDDVDASILRISPFLILEYQITFQGWQSSKGYSSVMRECCNLMNKTFSHLLPRRARAHHFSTFFAVLLY